MRRGRTINAGASHLALGELHVAGVFSDLQPERRERAAKLTRQLRGERLRRDSRDMYAASYKGCRGGGLGTRHLHRRYVDDLDALPLQHTALNRRQNQL